MLLFKGTILFANGTSGTVTLPAGARVLKIAVHASASSATMAVFGTTAVPIPNAANWLIKDYLEYPLMVPTAAPTIVFTNTDSYTIDYVGPAGDS